MFSCSANSSRRIQEEERDSLLKWLQGQDTNPELTLAIIYAVKEWQNTEASPPFHRFSTDVREALRSQSKISWNNFFCGFITSDLLQVQRRHFDRQGSMRTGFQWLVRLIQRVWIISWRLWADWNEHVHSCSQNALEPVFRSQTDSGPLFPLLTKRKCF